MRSHSGLQAGNMPSDAKATEACFALAVLGEAWWQVSESNRGHKDFQSISLVSSPVCNCSKKSMTDRG
jgi:hypothetical protein